MSSIGFQFVPPTSFSFVLSSIGVEPRDLRVSGKCSAAELHPWFLLKIDFYPSFSYRFVCVRRTLSKPWDTITATSFSFVFLLHFYFICMGVLPTFVYGDHRGQKRVSDS